MKFQDSIFNGLKVTEGTKSVTHAPKVFQSWGHKDVPEYILYLFCQKCYFYNMRFM